MARALRGDGDADLRMDCILMSPVLPIAPLPPPFRMPTPSTAKHVINAENPI
jgi:hypothetical protein